MKCVQERQYKKDTIGMEHAQSSWKFRYLRVGQNVVLL